MMLATAAVTFSHPANFHVPYGQLARISQPRTIVGVGMLPVVMFNTDL